MPDRYECLACHGTYDAVSADRVPYAHVCPPEILVIAQPLGGAILERPLSAWAGITLVPDQATADQLVAAGADPATIAIGLSRREARRPGHRDENPDRTAPAVDGIRPIVSEGAGRRRLPDPPTPARRA